MMTSGNAVKLVVFYNQDSETENVFVRYNLLEGMVYICYQNSNRKYLWESRVLIFFVVSVQNSESSLFDHLIFGVCL